MRRHEQRSAGAARRHEIRTRTHLVQTVQHRVVGRHRAQSATRPPVRTKLGLNEVLLHVEQLRDLRDVVRGHLRLTRAVSGSEARARFARTHLRVERRGDPDLVASNGLADVLEGQALARLRLNQLCADRGQVRVWLSGGVDSLESVQDCQNK